jgi:hypothetical protein
VQFYRKKKDLNLRIIPLASAVSYLSHGILLGMGILMAQYIYVYVYFNISGGQAIFEK